MCLFLPDENDRLPALVDRVFSEPGFLDRHVTSRKVEVGDFRIPKFKILSSFEAYEILKEIGLLLPFNVDPYKGGKLTEMVDSPPGELQNYATTSICSPTTIEDAAITNTA
ncbi:hypothetical protein PS2_027180 [Malus domestica]